MPVTPGFLFRIRNKIFFGIAACILLLAVSYGSVSVSSITTLARRQNEEIMLLRVSECAQSLSLELAMIEEKIRELEVHIHSTLNMEALRRDRNYLARYESVLAPFVQHFADKRTPGVAAWVYFDPRWSDTPHDIYFVDGDGDGKADRQTYIPFSYYDGTPKPNDDKEWWYGPLRTRKGFWTNPYEWTLVNKEVIKVTSYAYPLIIDGEVVGVIGTYYRFNAMQRVVEGLKTHPSSYAALYNEELGVVIHPHLKPGTRYTNDNLATAQGGAFRHLAEIIRAKESGVLPYTEGDREYLLAYSTLSNGWTLTISSPMAEVYAEEAALTWQLLITAGACVAVALLLAYVLGDSITRPLLQVVSAARAIGNGRLDTQVPVETRDEISILATSLNSMTRAMLDMTQKLRASYERMQDIITGARMHTWEFDLAKGVFRHDAAWCVLAQYPGEPHDGEFPLAELLEHVHPDDHACLVEMLLHPKAGAFIQFDLRLLLPDGGQCWVRIMGRAEGDPATGVLTRLRGAGFDVTAEKNAAASEAMRKKELENMVDERTRELVDSRNRAEAASRAKSTFLSTVSHEIRTPMNAILGFAHLFKRGNLEPVQREYLDKIKLAADALLHIINDVLDISKIESGKLEMERAPFYLNTLIDTVCSIVGFAARDKGIELRVDVAPNVPAILLGDQKRISQILMNLLNNAVKFTSHGSVTLSVSLSQPGGSGPGARCASDARPEAAQAGAAPVYCLAFSVTDTGIGLSQAQIDRLFQPFMQADSSITRKYGGTGLGLAICKQLVELMGGSIGVTSEPGRGSTFRFTLLLPEADVAPVEFMTSHMESESITEQNLKDIKGARLLVVEDNLLNQEIARALLEGYGMVVDMADDGVAAVEKVQHAQYDLIFMDMQMPRMDGLECTRRLRAMGAEGGEWAWLARVPILAMTANALSDDRDACLAAGMNDHTSKPLDPPGIQRSLVYWLKGMLHNENTPAT